MSLKPVSGEIKSQDLNDNFSYLDSLLSTISVNTKVFGAKGDGITDDTANIQNAIISAKSKGYNSVFFPPGTYMADVQNPIYVPTDMTLWGIKGQSVIKAIASSYKNAPGSTLTNSNNPSYINSLFVTGDTTSRIPYANNNQGYNIHFDGLVLDGNGQNVNQSTYTFNKSGNGSGIRGFWVRNFTVKNCKVRNWLGSGVYTYACTHVNIADNLVHDNGLFQYNANNGYSYANGLSRNGISVAGGYDSSLVNTSPFPYSYDYIIKDNMVYNNVDEGIMFAFQKRLLITGNHVHNNGDRGIEGDSGYTTTDTNSDVNGDITISHNFIYDNVTHGVTVDSSNNQKINITNNMVRNCGKYGIFAEQKSGAEIKITNNMVYDVGTTVDGTAYHGITADADEVTIQNNVVYNCSTGAGINIPRGLNIIASGNKTTNTKLSGINFDLWNQGAIGTHVNSVNINGNSVYKSKLHGININIPSNTAYNRIRQLLINSNTVFDYGEGSSQHSCYGIYIRTNVNADSVVILGNTVFEDRTTKLGANAIFFQGITQGAIVNAIIIGNELMNGSDWTVIDGHQYITSCVIDGNSIIGHKITRGTAPPTTGSWNIGDILINTHPVSNSCYGWICLADGTPGFWKEFGFVRQQRSSQLVYSGDGTSTTKQIPHGLSSTPVAYFVQAVSTDAGNAVVKRVTADATNLNVTFNSAPIVGTNNVTINWRAEQ